MDIQYAALHLTSLNDVEVSVELRVGVGGGRTDGWMDIHYTTLHLASLNIGVEVC